MPKPRARTAPPTAEEIEAFGNQAEQPKTQPAAPSGPQSEQVSTPIARPRKVKEPKTTGYTLRMTAAEKALLTHAAESEDISEQKVLERLVWPVLRERYGDLNHD